MTKFPIESGRGDFGHGIYFFQLLSICGNSAGFLLYLPDENALVHTVAGRYHVLSVGL